MEHFNNATAPAGQNAPIKKPCWLRGAAGFKGLSENTLNFILRHLIGVVFAALVFAGLEWLFGRAA